MKFSVSVIIPVYNGEKFIAKAVESVLELHEVTEIVIINDGSTDKTQIIIQELSKQYEKVKTYNHNGNLNRGRSASRNLGIKMASEKYLAFLDADDFYLPNRFTSDKKLFQENSTVDGVYNAIGVCFYREATKAEQSQLKLTTIREDVKPEELFEVLLSGTKGHFSIDGLTVKKSVFEAVGFFNEAFEVSEDTEIIWKMSLKCQLYTGIIDAPVAIRGVHGHNVFNKEELYKKYKVKIYESLVFWSSKNKIALQKIDILLKWLWLLKYKEKNTMAKYIIYWFYLFGNNKLLFSKLSLKYFPLVRLRKKIVSSMFG